MAMLRLYTISTGLHSHHGMLLLYGSTDGHMRHGPEVTGAILTMHHGRGARHGRGDGVRRSAGAGDHPGHGVLDGVMARSGDIDPYGIRHITDGGPTIVREAIADMALADIQAIVMAAAMPVVLSAATTMVAPHRARAVIL